jgi:hypothetical protein
MFYDVDTKLLTNDWEGTIEEFQDAISDESHPRHDEAADLMYQYGHDDEDEDWVTDRKGGFQVEWSLENDS